MQYVLWLTTGKQTLNMFRTFNGQIAPMGEDNVVVMLILELVLKFKVYVQEMLLSVQFQ